MIVRRILYRVTEGEEGTSEGPDAVGYDYKDTYHSVESVKSLPPCLLQRADITLRDSSPWEVTTCRSWKE